MGKHTDKILKENFTHVYVSLLMTSQDLGKLWHTHNPSISLRSSNSYTIIETQAICDMYICICIPPPPRNKRNIPTHRVWYNILDV